MATSESQVVTWVLESNADQQWALCAHVAGERLQLSPWYATRAALIDAIKVKAGVVIPPSTGERR